MTHKTVDYYMALHYPYLLQQLDDGDWSIKIPDLPGCMSHGASVEEALKNIEEAKLAWLTSSIEHGDPIAEPEPIV